MKQYIDVLTKAVLAGILIGISGIIYLSAYEGFRILGIIMFGFGLLVILAQGYNLYTGKVGYLIDNKPRYCWDILIMIGGNVIGTTLVALTARLAGLTNIIDVANTLIDHKLSYSWYQILGLSILCGFTMYIAAEGYRRIGNDIARVVIVIFAVTIFLLGRFQHSIADIFYFTLAMRFNGQIILFIVLMLIGNALGAIILNALEKVAKLKDNVCPISYYDEVKKEPKPKIKNQYQEPHNFD